MFLSTKVALTKLYLEEEIRRKALLQNCLFLVTTPLISSCKLRQNGGVAEGEGKTKLCRVREQNGACLEAHLRVVLFTCPNIQALYSMKDMSKRNHLR